MAVYELPNSVDVCGITLQTTMWKHVIKVGTDIDAVELDKETDVLIATYSRTGTTWLSQIVTLLQAGEDRYNEVSNMEIESRAKFVEYQYPDREPEIVKLKTLPPPRVAKTHLPYKFVNHWVERDQVKTILTLRNPKDTLVSYFHFYKMAKGFKGSWAEFFEHIQAGKQLYGDQVDWMESWWESRHRENILFVKYEDMLRDLPTEMKKVIHFLKLDVTEETFTRVLTDASFASMKDNDKTNYSSKKSFDQSKEKFIRKGQVGEWKKYFTVADNDWFDEKYSERLEKFDLQYE